MTLFKTKTKNIKGSRVLVTGASSGIGRACAFELARKGSSLTLTSRRFEALKEVSREISHAFPEITAPLAIPCDVTDGENVERMVKKCVARFGGIDVLINNAGIGVYGEAARTHLDDYRLLMEVNYFGSVNCILKVLPIMKEAGKGLIVNIASTASKHGVPYLSGYCASKAALVALSQSLRAELSDMGISVMIVCPGYTQTEFFKKEKNVGGAHRPAGPYMPVYKVAKSIIQGIEKERRNLNLSITGKALALSHRLAPGLVEMSMRRIAINLHDK